MKCDEMDVVYTSKENIIFKTDLNREFFGTLLHV